MAIKKVKATDGSSHEYEDKIIGSGGMKDVYFTKDKKNVVAFYRDKPDPRTRERLEMIVNKYNPTKDPQTGTYWQKVFCWPSHIVENENGNLGIVAPKYSSDFFFSKDKPNSLPMKGREKQGKWFASGKLRRVLDASELGDWSSYLKLCIIIARGVRRLHMGGLAHSDLSYKNILIDPKGINACIIDIDSLVVPSKYPPDVMGTPDFIAPEVLKTSHLAKDDKNRIHPSADTDRHALAVLIYLYLFFRHPLRGGKNHDLNDSANDEKLMMGEKALFVEHPTNKENRVKQKPNEFMPWVDPDKIPYTIAGDFLVPLFNRAFIDGLHNPSKRPTSIEWETALVRSMDLLLNCPNPNCSEKWYIFNNAKKPSCPFCGTTQDRMPVLNLYKLSGGSYMSENVRSVVYDNKALLKYNINANIPFDERSNPAVDKKVVGYFKKKKGKWFLKNEDMPELTDANSKQKVSIGSEVELTEGTTLILDKSMGGRSIMVQMIG